MRFPCFSHWVIQDLPGLYYQVLTLGQMNLPFQNLYSIHQRVSDLKACQPLPRKFLASPAFVLPREALRYTFCFFFASHSACTKIGRTDYSQSIYLSCDVLYFGDLIEQSNCSDFPFSIVYIPLLSGQELIAKPFHLACHEFAVCFLRFNSLPLELSLLEVCLVRVCSIVLMDDLLSNALLLVRAPLWSKITLCIEWSKKVLCYFYGVIPCSPLHSRPFEGNCSAHSF